MQSALLEVTTPPQEPLSLNDPINPISSFDSDVLFNMHTPDSIPSPHSSSDSPPSTEDENTFLTLPPLLVTTTLANCNDTIFVDPVLTSLANQQNLNLSLAQSLYPFSDLVNIEWQISFNQILIM
jgi:hypothetical protein